MAWPCGSVEADASAVTVTGAVPLDGVTVSDAVGGWIGAETVTDLVVVAVRLDVLVTVTSSEGGSATVGVNHRS